MYKELYCCQDYLVSDEGFVLNKKGTAPLKYSVNHNGYAIINICVDGKRKGLTLHNAVLKTFLPLEKYSEQNQINHIDGNKLNNHLNNLEWVTGKENRTHAINILGKRNDGKFNSNSKRILGINVNNSLAILEFNSLGEAGRYLQTITGKNAENIKRGISSVIHGRNNTAYGYKWHVLE